MIKGDKALTPQIAFTGTKATITAWAGAVVGMEAISTDTAERGTYDGAVWQWTLISASAYLTSANIEDSINNGTTDKAPSENAVYDALALKQTLDSDLTAIAALSPANDDIIQRKAGVWTSRTVAQYLADIKLSNGIATNYKIVPSVASNNLTVALKGLDGNDPSPTNPIVVQIGGAMRTITAALLVTKNAGTNWCNAGGAELATFETDYFVYLGYNATDGVTIGWSRINHATRYDDFSATSTNDLYCAISTITNAAASDNYVVIGRFAATLSAGAGYIWTVPTYTTTNLIQRPIYETRLLNCTSARTGFNAALPTMTISYKLVGRSVTYGVQATAAGTSNATTFTMSLPFTSNSKNYAVLPISGVDNGSALDRPSAVYVGASSRIANMYKYFDLGTTLWTASGNKYVNGTFYYEI